MASLDLSSMVKIIASTIDDSVEHKFCERTVLKTIFHENSWWILLFFLSVKTMTTAETKEDINLCFFLATKTDNYLKLTCRKCGSMHSLNTKMIFSNIA